eukprot:3090630-Rhodomonas_salina.1
MPSTAVKAAGVVAPTSAPSRARPCVSPMLNTMIPICVQVAPARVRSGRDRAMTARFLLACLLELRAVLLQLIVTGISHAHLDSARSRTRTREHEG